jgi:ribose transport system permease protein
MATDTAMTRPSRDLWERLLSNQAFWVTIAVIVIPVMMTLVEPSFSEAFWKEGNFFNITRNFAFIAIMALGQVAVIITGGIDLSVGSVLAVCGIVLGVLMENYDMPFWVGALGAILTGVICGAINGYFISYLRLSAFVVTLGMMSIGRSLALVISDNKFFSKFGHDKDLLIAIGGGKSFGIANPVIILLVLTILTGFVLRYTGWGRHLYAIGGNENAARLTGVPVDRMKFSVYMISGLMTAISAILTVGWLGSVTNGLGVGYELRVIASTVIGGANLLGGEGGAYSAVIGAALLEVIRNSLLLAGVNPYWQNTFVGIFLILAVLLERIRGRKVN